MIRVTERFMNIAPAAGTGTADLRFNDVETPVPISVQLESKRFHLDS